jgi:RNA polymerase sigma factor (sigma-70 family)
VAPNSRKKNGIRLSNGVLPPDSTIPFRNGAAVPPGAAARTVGQLHNVSTTAPIVYIVDDNASFLAATSRLVRASGFAVHPFASPSEFLARRDVDAAGCVVADLQMPGLNGLDLQTALGRTRNPVPVLFLTGHDDIPTSVRAMREGAEDVLTKTASKAALVPAIRRALARNAREREERARRRELCAQFEKLTEREREVLEHVVRGSLNKQIAADLGIVEQTVKVHRARVMQKMRVQSVAELVRLTERRGISESVQRSRVGNQIAD